MRGSCLCGAVRFSVTGTATTFDLCHCSRCRTASGSAFLAELELRTAELEWANGQSLVRTYEAPVRNTPPGYRRAFCAVCGAPVPTVIWNQGALNSTKMWRCFGPIRYETKTGLGPDQRSRSFHSIKITPAP